MGTFVTGNTPLPALKTNASPPTANTSELDAADINNLWSAAGDLRTAVLTTLVDLSTNQSIGGIKTFTSGLKAPALDTASAIALALGATNATSVVLGKAAVPAQAPGNLTVAASVDTTAAGALTVGGGNATSVVLGKAAVPTTIANLATAGVLTNTSAGVAGTLAGTTTTLLHGNAAGLPTFSAVNLTAAADVTGTLPIGNGGTGSASQNFVDLTTGQSVAGTKTFVAVVTARVVLTYSAAIATDASLGNSFSITATNGTAFTINNPTNLGTGQRLLYIIRNTSGGAHGLITWGATFKTAAAALTVTTAFSRSIEFVYDGANLVELWRGAADVAN